jgi:hypothetical protein
MQPTQLHDARFLEVLWNEKARIIAIERTEAAAAMTKMASKRN